MSLSNKTKTYTITAALPYANGPIHIGHVAGVYLPADIYARYLRRNRQRVLFISGSDEHGVPITVRAGQEGTSPQEVVDKYHSLNKKALEGLGISFDIFARTSSPIHHETATHFFKKLAAKEILEIHETEQYYDEEKQQFLSDRYIKGTCPRCSYSEAYGDQCEGCGTTLSPQELKNPQSALSRAAPILKKTKHWYLPLHKYESWLKQWILKEHTDWKSNVYGQCKSWLEQGLQPRAVTRDLSWGVPVPLVEGKDKVLYVWFDAPIGYISASKEWAQANQQDWQPFWQDPATKLIHFIGKDNIVFHCIIFPTMLQVHGDFILPQYVPANEFLNLEGKKLSTSNNHAVWLHEYLERFPAQQDTLRYVLCTNAPENKDSDFSWKDFQAKHNNELVAILGNLVNRTLVLLHKYFEGVVPEKGKLTAIDQATLTTLQEAPLKVGKAIETFHFKKAIQLCMEYAALGNKYLAETAPWQLIKTSKLATGTVLHITLQLIATLACLLEPFLPHTSEQLQKILQINMKSWDEVDVTNWIVAGTAIQKPYLLFTKIEDDVIAQQQAHLYPF